MSSTTENQGPTQHPMFIFGVLATVAVGAIIALVWASEEPGGMTAGVAPAPTESAANTTEERQTNTLMPPVVETSGMFVSPEDTDPATTPVSQDSSANANVAGNPSGLDIDLVVDPDRGAKGGPDPDGGAAPFYPTPSGPEGRDGNPFTTN